MYVCTDYRLSLFQGASCFYEISCYVKVFFFNSNKRLQWWMTLEQKRSWPCMTTVKNHRERSP